MKSKNIIFLVLLFIQISFPRCKKVVTISNTPSITFISVAPNPAVKYVDAIKIEFGYTDGDGDLGENTSDVKNLFITDSRNGVVYEKRIPQLAPDSSKIIIKGNYIVDLSPQGFVNDNDIFETTTFSIYVKDRAGNQSNTIETSLLTVKK